MRYLEAACLAALLAVLILAGAVLWQVHQAMPGVKAAIGSVQSIELNTTRTEAEMAGLLNTTRQIAISERAAQRQQLAQVQALAVQSALLLNDADRAVEQLGAAARKFGDLAPAVQAVLTTTDGSIGGIASDVHATMVSSQACC